MNVYLGTMESLNTGHFGTASFVLCKEVVLFERFKMYWNYRENGGPQVLCTLLGNCPYFGVSTIRDFTVSPALLLLQAHYDVWNT